MNSHKMPKSAFVFVFFPYPLSPSFHSLKTGVTHTYGRGLTHTYGIGVTHTCFEVVEEPF